MSIRACQFGESVFASMPSNLPTANTVLVTPAPGVANTDPPYAATPISTIRNASLSRVCNVAPFRTRRLRRLGGLRAPRAERQAPHLPPRVRRRRRSRSRPRERGSFVRSRRAFPVESAPQRPSAHVVRGLPGRLRGRVGETSRRGSSACLRRYGGAEPAKTSERLNLAIAAGGRAR